MVGDDPHHFHAQLPDTVAIEQIDQTMIRFRREDQHLASLVARAEGPVERQLLRQRPEPFGKRRRRIRAQRHHQPHEEAPGFGIVELMCLLDIPAMREQRGGDAGDDPRPVGARQRKKKSAHQSPAIVVSSQWRKLPA